MEAAAVAMLRGLLVPVTLEDHARLSVPRSFPSRVEVAIDGLVGGADCKVDVIHDFLLV